MFNRAVFNQIAYNRPSEGLITITVQLSSSSTASIRLICAVPLAVYLDGISSSIQNLITAVSAVLSAVSSLTHKDSARAHIASTGSMTASCWLVMYNAANLSAGSAFNSQVVHIVPVSYVSDGLSGTNFDLVRVRMQNTVLGSLGDTNFDLVRVYMQNAVLGSLGELRVLGEVTPWLALRFSGSVNPNDVIEIDTERMAVTINGQNALHLVDGRFWELIAGRNIIKYIDSETSRQVALTITFRDRWL